MSSNLKQDSFPTPHTSSLKFPKKVTLVEVSPRDGLQNEKVIIPTDIKIQFIQKLTEAGFPIIEATSFVNPKKIPALADHEEVFKHIAHTHTHTHYNALVPNLQGLEKAISLDCKNIGVLTAVSNTFLQKNVNCTIEESLSRIKDIITRAKPHSIFIRAYISCTLGCPFEGFIGFEKTAQLAKRLFEMGCDEICVADTIGTGTPLKAQELIQTVHQFIPINKIAIHFHDTYGQALANIFACLQLGVSIIDASVGGLGGCPYAPGASGNVATEKVLYMLNGMGIETGIDSDKLLKASRFIQQYLQPPAE